MTPSLTPSLQDIISDPSNASLLSSPAPKVTLAAQPAGVPMLKNLIGDQTPMQDPGPMDTSLGSMPLPSIPGTLRPLVTNPRQQQEDMYQERINKLNMPDPQKPGFWHALGNVATKIGTTALGVLAPGMAELIPGDMNYTQHKSDQLQGRLDYMRGQDETLANNLSKRNLEGAQTANENAQTDALLNPQVKPKEEEWSLSPEYTGPNGEPVEVEKNSGEMRIAGQPDSGFKRIPKPGENKESSPQQQTFDDLLNQGLTPIQAYEKIREKPGGTTINQGTWTLDEDPTTGKPVLFNSKTGETKDAPAGVAKAGTFAKAQAATEPAKQALDYATNYGNMPVHTGPGDEALMEKFFELAKPSTGFRMSQPQMDMLKNAQSTMGGMEAHLRHMTTGTWFSDNQRKQIVSTMGDLARAKGLSVDSTGQPGSGSQSDGKPNAGGQASAPSFQVRLADAMALPQNKGKSEADVRKDVASHGGEVVN
jgi:hypothetical protein